MAGRKRYRVAIVGCTGKGDYGHDIDVVWKEVPRCEIVAIADENPQGLAKAARRLGVNRTFADYRKMLDETKPDVLSICSRWVDRHAAMTIDAAQRGVHVFMEKPLCRTVAEADAVVDALDRTHVRLVVAHPARYTPEWQAAKKAIDEGRIGRILEMRGRGKEDSRGGGEDLWVLGSHILDMMIGVQGKPQWCFADVRLAGKPIQRSDVKPGNEGYTVIAGDAIHATYGFPGGVVGTFDSIRGAGGQPSRFALQIFGTKGIMEITSAHQPIVRVLDDPSWSPGRSGKNWTSLTASTAKPNVHAGHLGGIEDLLDSIEQSREPLCGAKSSRDVVEMIVAAFASAVRKTPTALPIEQRTDPLGAC